MGKFSATRVDAFITALILSSATGLGLLGLGNATARADAVILDAHDVNGVNAFGAQAASRAAADAVQTHTKDSVDIYQYSVQGGNFAGRFAAFATPSFASDQKSRDAALDAYAADMRVPTKAPPMQPASYQVAVWGTGFYDAERFTGTFAGVDFDRRTRTAGGLGGVDVLKRNLTSAADALLIGIIGGVAETRVTNRDGSTTRLTAPGVGVYGAYINGGFSVDGLFKADFIGQDDQVAGVVTARRLDNYVVGGNINYKMFVSNGWWWEPTVGVLHIATVWGDAEHLAGFQDGSSTRVQGGVRAGTQTMWGTVRVQPSVGAFLFSDVEVRGGTQIGAAPVPTDEGKLWGKGTAKLNVLVTDRVSFYGEGEIRATSDIVGGAGRVGARVSFGP